MIHWSTHKVELSLLPRSFLLYFLSLAHCQNQNKRVYSYIKMWFNVVGAEWHHFLPARILYDCHTTWDVLHVIVKMWSLIDGQSSY